MDDLSVAFGTSIKQAIRDDESSLSAPPLSVITQREARHRRRRATAAVAVVGAVVVTAAGWVVSLPGSQNPDRVLAQGTSPATSPSATLGPSADEVLNVLREVLSQAPGRPVSDWRGGGAVAFPPGALDVRPGEPVDGPGTMIQHSAGIEWRTTAGGGLVAASVTTEPSTVTCAHRTSCALETMPDGSVLATWDGIREDGKPETGAARAWPDSRQLTVTVTDPSYVMAPVPPALPLSPDVVSSLAADTRWEPLLGR